MGRKLDFGCKSECIERHQVLLGILERIPSSRNNHRVNIEDLLTI